MRRLLLSAPLALALMASAPAFAQQTTAVPATPQARASYAIGLGIGDEMRADGVPLDPEMFFKGLKDALGGAKPAFTDEEMEAALGQLQAQMNASRAERAAAAAQANSAQGEAFLKTNGAQPGVITTTSGLQYQILTAGTGPKPTASDTVSTRYRGTLIDGKEFDASGQSPVSFPVNRVIPGWTEALQLMPVGSKWRLVIPSNLAYGARGAGDDIGPNATLVFEIELVGIQ